VLIGFTAVYIAREWEKLVTTSFKFTSFGALAFERDVRGVSGCVGAGVGVRDRFIRMSQIAMLVNLDEVREVKDVWGSGGKWRLSVGEVRKVLGMRVEFG